MIDNRHHPPLPVGGWVWVEGPNTTTTATPADLYLVWVPQARSPDRILPCQAQASHPQLQKEGEHKAHGYARSKCVRLVVGVIFPLVNVHVPIGGVAR